MEFINTVSGLVLSAGWLITGILFAQQYWHMHTTKNVGGVSSVMFLGFAFLQANAALYATLNGHLWWLPGCVLAFFSCLLIAYKTHRG